MIFHPAASSAFWRNHFFLHFIAFLMLSLWVANQTRPVSLPDLHLAQGERLDCVSYAPYHLPGQTPLNPAMRIPKEQIAADLAALAPITHCVRIYAVDQGLEYVPELARGLGLKVLLGAWIGRDPVANRTQLETVIRLANRYPDTVRAVIVGNEVLLRQEQPATAMRAMLDEVRERVSVPVTYADVWEFWLRHPSLAEGVDFLTIHILPYWEDEPVAVDRALEHVAQVRQRMLEHYKKPVLIGETGWPSAGRQREGARPGTVEQAQYVRSFIRKAHDAGWDYNLIEAIDQPWKRLLEGTVGGYWGILDQDLQPKFPFAGPIQERASVQSYLLAALAGGVLCVALACLLGRARSWRLLTHAAAGAWAGGMSWLAWEHGLVAYRNPWEWTVLGMVALAGLGLVLGMAGRRDRNVLPGFIEAMQHKQNRWLPALRMAVLFAAATAALLLLADPRYRDFPMWLYALPLFSLLTLSRLARIGREEKLCAGIIALAGIARWAMEPMNPQAQAWLALCLLLAVAGLASTSKASTTAGADGSKQ
jgi:exo-beta-1,3-glucanase (GH17 family)